MADGVGSSTVSGAFPHFKTLCVFCGAKLGARPQYVDAARAMGDALVANGISLVYGGGTVGLMGEIARTVHAGLSDEGVIGVIPEALKKFEVAGELIGQTHVVPDMHTRKALMATLADGFVAMPGGFGTLEELMEVITWRCLHIHAKPIGLLNTGGFFDPLLAHVRHSVAEGFITEQASRLVASADPQELLVLLHDEAVALQALSQGAPIAVPGVDVPEI